MSYFILLYSFNYDFIEFTINSNRIEKILKFDIKNKSLYILNHFLAFGALAVLAASFV
jgi:hypothetical protein